MNLEALLVIGALALLLGGALYLPFYLWVRWKKKKTGTLESSSNARITSAGITFYGSMVVMLFVGFAQEHLAPQSAFGAFVSSSLGRLAYSGVVVTLWIVLEIVLTKYGFKFVEKRREDV